MMEPNPLRADYQSVLIESRSKTALSRLNPDAPASAITEAITKLKNPQKASLVQNNLSFHHPANSRHWAGGEDGRWLAG